MQIISVLNFQKFINSTGIRKSITFSLVYIDPTYPLHIHPPFPDFDPMRLD